MQLNEKPSCKVRVDRRFERRIQIGEGQGMLLKIDLHAANVDRSDSACLQSANRIDGVGFVGEI
jgi:hypothetical protein